MKNRYTHIHGRKGSGKTAVLSIYKGLAHLQNRPGANRVAQKKERIDGLVVEIVTWQKFHEMIQDVAEAVARTLYKNEFTEEIPLLPEKVEQSWTESIWEQIFTEVYNRYRQTTADGQLRFDQAQIGAVIKYIEGMDLLDDPKERRKVETHLLRRAKEEINNILDRHKLKCYVLFDSMEDYPVKNPTFLKVVGGYLRALARFEIQCPNACIVFALPEEIRPILFRLSSNKLKDFKSRIELRWRARDLLRMAAHQYGLFLRLHDSDWYSHVRHIDFAQARGRQEFFQSLFPVPVTNEFGDQEEPVAYILRHTQLLPRHLLIFLNEIARVSHAKAGGWRQD